MLEFGISFAAFLAAHILPAASGQRERAIAAWGRRRYLVAYSILSTVLLLWVISSAQRAPYVELWPPSPWRHAVPLLTMPVALALFGAAAVRPNPLSISLRRPRRGDEAAGVLSITRHPILWAFVLWSASHLVANGDLVAMALFASLALFSAQGILALDRRARSKLGEPEWRDWAAKCSLVPFAALLRGRNAIRFTRAEMFGALAGVFTYAIMLAGLHEWLFGIAPLWP